MQRFLFELVPHRRQIPLTISAFHKYFTPEPTWWNKPRSMPKSQKVLLLPETAASCHLNSHLSMMMATASLVGLAF
jgi:hypothetical protein